MPDWAIILVAAFGGGLAGAVLQPMVAHILGGMSANRPIRRQREGNLRRVVSRLQVRGAKLCRVWESLLNNFSTDRPGAVKLAEETYQKMGRPDVPQMEIDRIMDRRLRDSVRHYAITAAILQIHLLRVGNPLGDAAEYALPLARDLLRLGSEITRRMDELNWPELDD